MKTKLTFITAALALSVVVLPAQAECYSEGIRVGTVQKFSLKGTFSKSWEGELVMAGTKISGNGTSVRGGDVWKFSVLDAEVAKVIDEATMGGESVALKYCQAGLAGNLGATDTAYRITKAVIRK